MGTLHNVTFIVGATASGKSAMALDLAQQCGGHIFNCDSIQCYKDLVIGSALPNEQEMKLVPHHLFAYVSPPHEQTARDYRDQFFAEIAKLPDGVPVFVVGGTGFYFQAIEKGMFEAPASDPQIMQELQSELAQTDGEIKLHKELQMHDSVAAAKIHPHDHYRLLRALAIARSTGKKFSELHAAKKQDRVNFPFPLKKIGVHVEREILREKIRARARVMIKIGLIEEVQNLLNRGLRNWAPLGSVGYAETIEFLENNRSQDWLEENIAIHTGQLAKRQVTWFKRDSEIEWISR